MKPPLAEVLRPQTIDDVVGQEHLLGEKGWIRRSVESGRPLSILLWGPPGCGKTTLARLYAQSFRARFVTFSAVLNTAVDLKKLVKEAEDFPLLNETLILFVDEIHRFNKAVQDLFLPLLEKGTLVLIGATTENPSFALNNALLSRLRVLQLQDLSVDSLGQILERYEKKVAPLALTSEARQALLHLSQGDGRHLLNMIENLTQLKTGQQIDLDQLQACIQQRCPLYDRDGEGHYDLISALHKSIRGSDPDAALYWLCRMLVGGEDPQFIVRRLIRAASEDVGLADPQALSIALHGADTFERLGSPEGELALAQVVIYLALAPKSNALYTAFNTAKELASKTSQLQPPKIILNAPTPMMKELGYGEGYIYDHDTPEGCSGQNYFPDHLDRPLLYQPFERGFEREMKKRMDYFTKVRAKK
jgi:putative ATPase